METKRKKWRLQQRKWVAAHKDRSREIKRKSARKHYSRLKEKYYDNVVCIKCGGTPIHYHHIDPSTKKYNISQMIYKSDKEIETEIEKCIPLCQTCHSRE